jgi:hypothetical protein
VFIAVVTLLLRYVVPKFVPDALFIGVMAQFVGAILTILWWLFFSQFLRRIVLTLPSPVSINALLGKIHEFASHHTSLFFWNWGWPILWVMARSDER